MPNVGSFADPARLVRLAQLAEAKGWDGVFLWDMITPVLAGSGDAPVVDPWVLLAAMAHATDRIRLGPMVTPLARHPQKVALEAATLQTLSASRFILEVA